MARTREQIKTVIQGLLLKTEAAGCSEAEAIQAAERVGKLLTEYSMTMSDVEIGQSTCVAEEISTGNRTKNSHPISWCMVSIADYCDVESWVRTQPTIITAKNGTRSVKPRVFQVFFGLPQDVEIARYIYDIICRAQDTEVEKFKQSDYYVGLLSKGEKKVATTTFLRAMSSRLCFRLDQMKVAQVQTTLAETGRDLVPVKESTVKAALDQAGYVIGPPIKHKLQFDRVSAVHGEMAGNRVGLTLGISEGDPSTLLPYGE